MGAEMFVVLIGQPGAGKGTQSAKLVDYLGVVHLSTGQILRAAAAQGSRLGQLADNYIHAGKLVPDDVIINLIADRLSQPDCRPGCLLDGFPRTLPQARELNSMLANHGQRIDAVLAMHVPREELERRLVGRGNSEGREDDAPETILRRMEIFHKQTAPLIDYYREQSVLHDINAVGTTDEVFARICDAIDSSRHDN